MPEKFGICLVQIKLLKMKTDAINISQIVGNISYFSKQKLYSICSVMDEIKALEIDGRRYHGIVNSIFF